MCLNLMWWYVDNINVNEAAKLLSVRMICSGIQNLCVAHHTFYEITYMSIDLCFFFSLSIIFSVSLSPGRMCLLLYHCQTFEKKNKLNRRVAYISAQKIAIVWLTVQGDRKIAAAGFSGKTEIGMYIHVYNVQLMTKHEFLYAFK